MEIVHRVQKKLSGCRLHAFIAWLPSMEVIPIATSADEVAGGIDVAP
jgi:hypothetical protein